MSELFHNFDSNGATGDDSQDIPMASPSQHSPMTNSNSTSSNNVANNNNTSNSQNNVSNANNKLAGGGSGSMVTAENQPVRIRFILVLQYLI